MREAINLSYLPIEHRLCLVSVNAGIHVTLRQSEHNEIDSDNQIIENEGGQMAYFLLQDSR